MAFEAALKMDVSGFTSGINKATSGISSLAATVKGLAVVEYGGRALSAMADAVGAAFRGMYSAMEAGGALVDLSEQTGLAVDKLMVLKTAFGQAGMGAEEVQPVINRMQKAIESAATSGGPAAEAFQRMGLSASKLSGMRANEQLTTIGDAINKIQNPTQKAAAAMEIFGKSGGRALALFASGGLADAATAVGNQAQLMKENAGVFDKVTDILGTAATKLQGLYVGIASVVAPMLMSAVEAFNSIDLSGLGQQIGVIVAVLLEAFSQGVLGTIALESLKYAFVFTVNFLSSALSGLFAGLISYVVEGFKLLTTADFWGGMLTAIVGVAQKFIQFLANGISDIMDLWAGVPLIGEKAAKAAEGARKYAGEVGARGGENLNAAAPVLKPLAMNFAQNISDAAKAAAAAAPQMEQSTALPELLNQLKQGAANRIAGVQAANQLKELPGVTPLQQQAGMQTIDFASSLAKIGGSQFGPKADGGSMAVQIARQQLEEQRKATDRLNETNLLLKNISDQKSSVTYA